MKPILFIPIVFVLGWGLAAASPPTETATDRKSSPLDVISLNGQLNAQNGIMAYTLKKDGSFSSFPLADKGTWIEGKWKLEKSSKGLTVHVEGRWGEVNQSSQNNQFISMKVMMQPGVLHDSGHPDTDIYTCSVVVSESKREWHVPPVNTTPIPPGSLTLQGGEPK